MAGRAVIQIPAEDVVGVYLDRKKEILEIIVKGESYPRWHPGMEPMVVLGANQLRKGRFISDLIDWGRNG